MTEIEESLKKCKNQGIYYLLLSNKLAVLKSLKREEQMKTVYDKLKREFKNIPAPYRTLIVQTLSSIKASKQGNDLKESRKWSEIHLEDEVDLAIAINAKARTIVQEKNYKEASDKFLEVYEYALKYPHPTYIISGLNNASWHLRKKDKDIEASHDIVKQLAWHCGYWFDDSTVLINYLDTILVIAKRARDYDLFFSVAELIEVYYEKMLLIEPDCDEKYNGTLQRVRKHYGVIRNKGGRADEISNSKGIQNFMSEQIRIPRKFAKEHGLSNTSLYRIIKGEMKNLKISTLKKILVALNFPYSFENPKIINHFITIFKEKEYFQDNWKNAAQFSASN